MFREFGHKSCIIREFFHSITIKDMGRRVSERYTRQNDKEGAIKPTIRKVKIKGSVKKTLKL